MQRCFASPDSSVPARRVPAHRVSPGRGAEPAGGGVGEANAAGVPVLASVAISFNAPEYFALMLLGLISVVVFSQGSLLNALAMACFGVLLGLVGTDIETGTARYTFGVPELSEGLNLVAVGMGLLGRDPGSG